METEFKCERCKPGHDFKSKQNLKQHHQSSSHKRKFDPEFAAAEEADKATKKAARGEKEAARKAGDKETARKVGPKETARKAGAKETARKAGDKEKFRKAARDQRENNIKRKRSKAETEAQQRKLSIIQYRKQTDGDRAPWIKGNGTEEDALKALVRYHGSTSVAMLLHTDDDRIKSNIKNFVHVSPEAKAKIRKTWQDGEMATNRAHFSCATCGIRDHTSQILSERFPRIFRVANENTTPKNS